MKKLVNAIAMALAFTGTAGALQAVHAADYKPRIIRFGYGLAEDSNQGRAGVKPARPCSFNAGRRPNPRRRGRA